MKPPKTMERRRQSAPPRRFMVLAGAAVLSLSLPPRAGAEGEATAARAPVSYHREVRPILQRRCQGCHQPARAGGKLALTSYEALMAGKGGEKPVVVPGKPEESLLLEEIAPQDGDPPSMPKDGEPLSETDRDLIRRWIAEGCADDTPESAKLAASMERPPEYESPPVLTALDYSPDGRWLAVSGYHEVLLFTADGSERAARLVGLSERIESVAFSPDGKRLAVTGGSPARLGEVQVWDVETRKLRLSVPVTYDTLYGAAWSPDGSLVAFGCPDNTVRAIDAESGKQVLYQGAHNDWVLDAVFSTDASHLVSVSRDRSMKLIRVETQQFIDNITSITPGALKGGLMAVDRHPAKDEIFAGGADGVPKIYRMYREKARQIGDDYNLIRALDPMPGRIFDVEYSPDGSHVAAGSSADGAGQVRVYVEADGKLLWTAELPASVYCLAFSPDGKTLAAGGFDGTVRMINAESGSVEKQFVPVPLAF